MNRCAYQQRALVGGCVGVADMNFSASDTLVCPKPRRFRPSDSSIRPSRLLQSEASELKAGTELLDSILTKGGYDMETPSFEMGSSPPFFFGSPPSRASNPLIQDTQFGNHNFVPIVAIPQEVGAAPPSTSARKNGGGCIPAAVRIEGFNCRSSISAVA